jgi:hypothetical protein
LTPNQFRKMRGISDKKLSQTLGRQEMVTAGMAVWVQNHQRTHRLILALIGAEAAILTAVCMWYCQ